MMNVEDFYNLLNKKNNDVFRYAIIDINHSTGQPKVTFDGDTKLSSRTYPYLSTYTPQAGDKVLMVKVKGNYIILGGVK